MFFWLCRSDTGGYAATRRKYLRFSSTWELRSKVALELPIAEHEVPQWKICCFHQSDYVLIIIKFYYSASPFLRRRYGVCPSFPT